MSAEDIARLERRAARERAARKEAERLLEAKSRELWEANQHLRDAQRELEERVEERTAQLAKALEASERASREKTTFLAHMSHELRTPLTSILGYTADLVRERPDHEDLQTVERNATHLLALINEVLDLSKVESGTLEIVTAPVELAALLDELRMTFSPRAEAQGLTFRLSIDPEVPVHLMLDGLRLRQILYNLLGNALKFTSKGTLALRVFRQVDTVRFDVLDTGVGIPAEALPTLFEPFSQAHERDRGGTGLGLAISAKLAAAMGGGVTVKSTVGRGSCFTVSLPLLPSSGPREVTFHEGLPAEPLAGSRLLIADDASDSRRLLVRWCRQAGAEVVEAANGREAVQRAEGVDLVLMDMKMPVMGGDEATRRLRAQGFEPPVIALTANSMPEDREACLAAGCDGFVSKPVGRERLIRSVLSFLH